MSTKQTSESTEPRAGCTCLSACSQSVQHSLESIFGKLGYMIGSHPWITILLSIIIACCFGAGFINWTTESRTNKLWIPQNTKAEAHSSWVSQVFGFETRTEQILLRPYDNSNVLKAKYVQQYYLAHYLMVNHTSLSDTFQDIFPGLYSWDGYHGSRSLCLQLGSACDMKSILDIVGYNAQDIHSLTDEHLLQLLNDPVITSAMDLSSIIGGLEYDHDGNIISAAVLSGTYSVAAAAININNNFIDPSRETWEAEVNQKILDYNFADSDVIPYFQAAFSSEFSGAINGDLMAYVIGCFLLIGYTTIALGKRDYVHSMMGLALCAILTVGLAIVASYGLAAALSIIYTPLSSSLPFLALGLGVDDAFIIAGEFQQQIKDHLLKGKTQISSAELMQHTMKHAGVSILITSLTDFVAFGIGSSTVLPALRAYCLFAAFGVLFVFLLNVTFFAACVVIDHERASANRVDCCCCVKLKKRHEMFPELALSAASVSQDMNSRSVESNYKVHSYCCCLHLIPAEASRKMWKLIGEQIVKPAIRAVILIFALIMLSFGIYGANQLEQDFKIEWFIPDTSYLQEYYSWKSTFFDTGTPLFIYSRDVDYLQHKQQLLECNYLLRNASYLEQRAYDWHLSFWRYIEDNNISVDEDNYYSILQSFLYGVGAQYNGLIEWKNASQPELGLEGAFMIGEYKRSAVSNAAAQVDAMYFVRDDMEDIMDSDDSIFAFTFQMLFWEQYAVIAEEFFRNLALSVIVVFGITLLLIPKVSAALLVLFSVFCTIVDVMGFMWFWGLTIDAVTVCYTVIAIGLAVDYSAHVGEAFVLSTKATKNERVIDALHRIGASVFNGAFSTFLAVAAMANSQTYIFRVFFRQFFLVTVIGSMHGLIVLPALLSLFGPRSVLKQKEDKEDKNERTENINDTDVELNTIAVDNTPASTVSDAQFN